MQTPAKINSRARENLGDDLFGGIPQKVAESISMGVATNHFKSFKDGRKYIPMESRKHDLCI